MSPRRATTRSATASPPLSFSSVTVVLSRDLAELSAVSIGETGVAANEAVPVRAGRHAIRVDGVFALSRRLIAFEWAADVSVPASACVTVDPTLGWSLVSPRD